MANLAQLDLRGKGRETRIRAMLEDLVEEHAAVRPQARLALAVWYGKDPSSDNQHLLELLTGVPIAGIVSDRLSLLWRTGGEGAPYANVDITSVDHFMTLSDADPVRLARYRDKYEILRFDKKLLTPQILQMFQIVTEPPNLIKGWYVPGDEFKKSRNTRDLLSNRGHARPEIGLVKTQESDDFEHCRGILHVEVGGRWLPLSPAGIQSYTCFRDWQAEQPGYLLFEGGSQYQVLKFEFKTAPEYARMLLEKTPDDRYPEVYLRAVRPPAQPAA